MRMSHYYLALAILLAPALLTTAVLGALHNGDSQLHLEAGLVTAVLCLATNTLFILFMVVTGRVMKAAMRTRPLSPAFLAELNEFFATKRAFPMALFAALSVTATAVLGYGKRIGVPAPVHVVLGLGAVLLNLWTIPVAMRTLKENQGLLDRATRELDRLDRELGPVPEEATEIPWIVGARVRWVIFALTAWAPYLYWGLVVWKGDFSNLSHAFLIGSAILSGFGFLRAWRTEPTTQT
ncbi:MAG TPA: hypothetical protein ENJ09_15075 [Planctomycetes bacterium]|nr:hypothetical protein [Planctomycetota bacterium]